MCVSMINNKRMLTTQYTDQQFIYDHLFNYDRVHFTMIDFENVYLINQFNNTNETNQYIFGIIMSIVGIYYFLSKIVQTLYPPLKI